MAKKDKLISEALSKIDMAQAMADKVLIILDLIQSNKSYPLDLNAMSFLMNILKSLGVSFDVIEEWLTNFLVYVIPTLELSTKAYLLSNLKNMVGCSTDPRIPEKYRKKHKSQDDTESSQERGIDIDIESIDYLDKLSISPLSDNGKGLYFGLDGINDSYKFARADDFDAFLWFVIHKGKFPNSSIVKLDDNNNLILGNHKTTKNYKGSLLSSLEVTYNEDDPSTILLGNTFQYESGRTISMCIDIKYNDKGKILNNTIVPISDDWSSVNWYTRRANYFTKNIIGDKASKISAKRDYSKEIPICNIQYIDQGSTDSPVIGTVNNKLRFTILPKPLVYINPKELTIKKILFNENGDFDKNGKYTLSDTKFDEIFKKEKSKDFEFNEGKSKADVIRSMYECYKGLTIYEFNYDLIMGMKLFDARSIVSALFDTLQNASLGLSVGLEERHQESTDTIKEIIKNIINTDDSTVNDCYHTFSNERYNMLLSNTANKRLNRTDKFYDAKQILSASLSGDTVNEEEVLHRAITQAKVTVTEGSDGSDEYGITNNFMFSLLNNLITAIVQSLLSPKLLMVIVVNQSMMGGGKWEKFNFSNLFKALQDIIVGIVKEVKDLIIDKLWKLVATRLDPLITITSDEIVKEQLDSYADVLREIMKYAPYIFHFIGGQRQDTKIDDVDYADIDIPSENNQDTPNTNNC